jgi:L-lactate dehydrogenase complex protein LldG
VLEYAAGILTRLGSPDSMTTRKEMLEKVRRALGHTGTAGFEKASQSLDALPPLDRVLPPVAPSELVEKFEGELQKLAGIACRAASITDLDQILRDILSKSEGGPIVLSRNSLLSQLRLSEKLTTWGRDCLIWPSSENVSKERLTDFRRQCFEAKVGITGVEFVLAESGTLVLTSPTEGSQLASLAPPIHVALYRRAQVVESLEEVLARLPALRNPTQLPGRSVIFITGPSRTADIEQISIRGVHGPKHVYAVLVEDSCLS